VINPQTHKVRGVVLADGKCVKARAHVLSGDMAGLFGKSSNQGFVSSAKPPNEPVGILCPGATTTTTVDNKPTEGIITSFGLIQRMDGTVYAQAGPKGVIRDINGKQIGTIGVGTPVLNRKLVIGGVVGKNGEVLFIVVIPIPYVEKDPCKEIYDDDPEDEDVPKKKELTEQQAYLLDLECTEVLEKS